MDFSESTRIVFNRIQKIEPELVSKIVGHLLFKEDVDREMIRLAFGPDRAIHSLINEAKATLPGLVLSSKPPVSPPLRPLPGPDLPLMQFMNYSPLPHPFSSPPAFRVPSSYGDAQLASNQKQATRNSDCVPIPYADFNRENDQVHDQAHFLSFDEQLDSVNHMGPNFSSNYHHQEAALAWELSIRASRRSSSVSESPVKSCHYFLKGYCKHGTNCRYFHGHSDSFSQTQLSGQNSNELVNEEHLLSPGSLEKLELELSELLKSRGGHPISIAMLPMMYYERYGKVLQGEGYLTESQRHGKAGYSLTKLLARLKNSVRILDRPHGQHSVVLAEDAPKYMEYTSERSDPTAVVVGSQQIYLTFPAESTFTDEDVSNYFRQYGPVSDVRIPCQQKRMFGFVTFVYPETVNIILTKGNPHYVSGSRILVKPYREKSRVFERKYTNRIDSPMYYPSHYLETDPELHSMPSICNNTRILRKQQNDDHEQALELQRCLSELHLAPKPLTWQPYFGYNVEEMKVPDARGDSNEFLSADHFSHRLDVLDKKSLTNEKALRTSNNYSDQDSSQVDLPVNPFASPPIGSSAHKVL